MIELEYFEIPVVLFLFKRKSTTIEVMKVISEVKPKKLYLLGDAGRNEEEKQLVEDCRTAVESLITWNCEVVRHYAKVNIGVYKNIGMGARWVFSQEEQAVFLEDDNLPDKSFFRYCKEMLSIYKNDTRVLWVCGTNYLEEFTPDDEASYMFTSHLLPCGWASWKDKFLMYYDGNLKLAESKAVINRVKATYGKQKALYRQQLRAVQRTQRYLQECPEKASWDYQMMYSLRANHMYGISPCVNLIKNIGANSLSTHGGVSLKMPMTKRFCDRKIKQFPVEVKHPASVLADTKYETLIGKVILEPVMHRIVGAIKRSTQRIIGERLYSWLKLLIKKR